MTGGFFAVFDDIAILLDDAAAMSKVATKKTAGILGDDLAVSAQKASGFASSRELPVLWAISKGSFKNKLIILPFAFVLSAVAPWLIVPVLMLGGVYLAYEGAEKVYEYFYPHEKTHVKETTVLTEEEILEVEKEKIKSAIVTDFVLSVEIIIMALGSVMEQSIQIQILVVTFVAILATVGVYGTVGLLVRMDDLGFKLIEIGDKKSKVLSWIGNILVQSLPKVIRLLTIVGTIAMLLVAGGIFVHNIHQLHEIVQNLPGIFADTMVGLIIGGIALSIKKLFIKESVHE